VAVIAPVASTIIEAYRKKGGRKATNTRNSRKDGKIMIRRQSDGRQVSVGPKSQLRLDWLDNGDALYVGPSFTLALENTGENVQFPHPPCLNREHQVSLLNQQEPFPCEKNETLSPQRGAACESSPKIPVIAAMDFPPTSHGFPILEGNVLNLIRNAINGHPCFVERQVCVDRDHSFLSFDYDEISADMRLHPGESRASRHGRLLRRECRGLVLNAKTGEVLARRLHKFWTLGEVEESQIVRLPPLCANCILTEKVDGSLVTPFLLGDELLWASKRALQSNVGDFVANKGARCGITALALHCIVELDSTPIFEWIDPKAPIVVRYDEERLVLLAIRNRSTGQYLPDDEVRKLAREFSLDRMDIPVAARLPIDLLATPTLTALVGQIKEWGSAKEGAVLRFPCGTFVKIKTDWYIKTQQIGSIGKRNDGSGLIRWIKKQRGKPGSLPLGDLPLSVVLSASLRGALRDAQALLKAYPLEWDQLCQFSNDVETGLGRLHESLQDWGRDAHEASGGIQSALVRHVEALVYSSKSFEENKKLLPWSVETLMAYGRLGSLHH